VIAEIFGWVVGRLIEQGYWPNAARVFVSLAQGGMSDDPKS
jgi:hypothetical protein